MAENSKIQWTHHTFNPWRGCTKVSAGCAHCYAETLSGRNHKTLGVWGPHGTRVVAAESMWREPLKWDKAARHAMENYQYGLNGARGARAKGFKCDDPVKPERPRVFCASLADVFEEWQGPMMGPGGVYLGKDFRASTGKDNRLTMDDVRRRLFGLINSTPNLNWLLLTKRPENVKNILHRAIAGSQPVYGMMMNWAANRIPPKNVWLGVSVENQATADERIPHLLRVPAAVRFLSCEPLLEAVDLARWLMLGWCAACDSQCFVIDGTCRGCAKPARPLLSWVIIGGESGPHARPCNPSWIKDIVNQCQAAGVPCFVKQLGSNVLRSAGKFRDHKGGDPSEWPEDLRVREFPNVARQP